MSGLHAVSVPVLIRYLGRLDGLLVRLAAFAKAEGRDEAELLATSLADDMFDLRHQFLIATGFSIRALLPAAPQLAGLLPVEADTIADLRARIAERIDALGLLDPAEIDARESAVATERAGETEIRTDALAFVTQYALPNFFFHFMAAYAILRRIGLPLGKADFDGFHTYPPDFRFV